METSVVTGRVTFSQALYHYKELLVGQIADRTLPYWVTPNLISWMRLVLAVVNIGIFLLHLSTPLTERSYTIFVILFTAAVISDFIDGPLARTRKLVSQHGAQIDPLADKLTVLPPIWFFLWDTEPLLVSVVIGGDVLATFLRWQGFRKQIDASANILGKLKMVAQTIGVYLVVLLFPVAGAITLWIGLALGLGGIFLNARQAFTK